MNKNVANCKKGEFGYSPEMGEGNCLYKVADDGARTKDKEKGKNK